MMFEIIPLDGDHTEAGAFDDLKNVIPNLSVGGILVFDDIAHPSHPYLLNFWKQPLRCSPSLLGLNTPKWAMVWHLRLGRGHDIKVTPPNPLLF